jgi:hypothetical protein
MALARSRTGGHFLHYEFSNLQEFARVVVQVTDQTMVRLMDDGGWNAYENHIPYEYLGGLAQRTVIVFRVPRPGAWHVVIDTYPVAEVKVRAFQPTIAELGKRLGSGTIEGGEVDVIVRIPGRIYVTLVRLCRKARRTPEDVIGHLLAIACKKVGIAPAKP